MEHKAKWPVPLHQSSSIQPTIMIMITTRAARNRRFIHGPLYYAFDLLWLNGDDLRSLPLIERKRHLHELVRGSRCHAIIYAQHIEDQGIGLFEEICALDLEGIVAKRKRGVYKNNGLGCKKSRTRSILKRKAGTICSRE